MAAPGTILRNASLLRRPSFRLVPVAEAISLQLQTPTSNPLSRRKPQAVSRFARPSPMVRRVGLSLERVNIPRRRPAKSGSNGQNRFGREGDKRQRVSRKAYTVASLNDAPAAQVRERSSLALRKVERAVPPGLIQSLDRVREQYGLDGRLIQPANSHAADGPLVKRERLGGLLRYFYREAA